MIRLAFVVETLFVSDVVEWKESLVTAVSTPQHSSPSEQTALNVARKPGVFTRSGC